MGSAVKRMRPVPTIHPGVARFYAEKAKKKKAWEEWLKEHSRRTAMIQSLIIKGKLDERSAKKEYEGYI